MPVRLLNSSVFKWPDAKTVDAAVRRWTARVVREHPEVLRIGYFGSYARGDWGVGSDLDMLIIVSQSDKPFEMRASQWDTWEIPVPTDLLVYTKEEWGKLLHSTEAIQKIEGETTWIWEKQADDRLS